MDEGRPERQGAVGRSEDSSFLPGKVFSPAGMMIWPAANAIYRRETYDNYPAAKAILPSVFEGLQLPMDLALAVESRYFAKILRSKEAAAMIRSLFLSMGELNKGARRPAEVAATKLKKIGVIGAGFMGAGVAYVSASAGLEVVLIDRDQDCGRQGQGAFGEAHLEPDRQGPRKSADRDALLSRITRDRRLRRSRRLRPRRRSGVRGSRASRRRRRRRRRRSSGPTSIFASNTSTLPITSLAPKLAQARKFRRHPFLLAGRQDDAGRDHHGREDGRRRRSPTAIDFVRAIKKTPIVVNDCRGFYANRCVGNYIRKAI